LKRELAGLLDLASAPGSVAEIVRDFIESIPRRVAWDAVLADLEDMILRAREIAGQLLVAIGATERSSPQHTRVPPSHRPDSMTSDRVITARHSRMPGARERTAAEAEAVVTMGHEVGIEPEEVIAIVRKAGLDACRNALTDMVARASGRRRRDPLRNPAAYLRTLVGIKRSEQKRWSSGGDRVKMTKMQERPGERAG
jgi:hypothetical protein